ncbi:hypothetical protein BJ138DRAFT_1123041 [Hygrophoropsis aurantiaca]|uniref:Uncharacterized protein n=1 Tax=Hygrophoropsis aurantiaca TaxID=72124 RepID=A0ACB8AP63_9AGAM|nr:hypothetical protein BJ138DRAFT_1123041 [Hygrophoropsis aurantiaca]
MEPSPVFLKVRASTFVCIISFSFLWIVLLSVEMFTRWDISDLSCRSLMAILALTNTVTVIVLPVLLLLPFRVWLDAARLLLLLVIQIGSAAAFTYWNPKFHCPDQSADQLGVCKLINVYTVMGCWIIPALLVIYTTNFTLVVYHQSRTSAVVFSKAECFEGRSSILPIMDPERAQYRPSESLEKVLTPASDSTRRLSPIVGIKGSYPNQPTMPTSPPQVHHRTSHPLTLQPRAVATFDQGTVKRFTISTALPVSSSSDAYAHASSAQEIGEKGPRCIGRLSKPLPQRFL